MSGAASTIYVSNSGSVSLEQFNDAGVGAPFGNAGGNTKVGLATDNAGNLYVSDDVNNKIFKYTPSGVSSVFASTSQRPGRPGIRPRRESLRLKRGQQHDHEVHTGRIRLDLRHFGPKRPVWYRRGR